MKPYPKYKDSGIEWIGEVPEGWEVIRTRYVFNFLSGNGFPHHFQGKTEGNYPFYKVSDINLNGINVSLANNYVTRADVEKNGWTIIPEKSILLAKIGEALKKNHRKINASECLIDNNMLALVKRNNYYNTNYLYYLMLLIDMVWFINPGAVPSIDLNKLRDFFVAIPEKAEQKFITAYLNRKTTQIDNLISKKQKLIELLKEERAAIINQAVTKGLNPDAPMKDSGIDWLGEVPEHWEVKKLKYIASINEKNLSEKTDATIEIKYVDIGNVCLGSIVNEPETMYFKDAPSMARRIVKKGDTIISTVRTYLKAITYIPEVTKNLIVSTGFAVIRPKDDFDKKFISFLLTSEKFVDTICSLSVGVSYPAINARDIANIIIWFPQDKAEQTSIVEQIDKETTKIDQATFKIKKQIDLLKEFRTALISEVVTGKIDVRT